MEQKHDFSTEGLIEVGSRADFFVFMNGEQLGKLLSQHSGIEPIVGEYTKLGRAGITIEWLEDDEVTESVSQT